MMSWWAQLVVGLAVGACVIGVILRLFHSMTPENHNWRTCQCEACTRKRYLTNLREDAEQKKRKVQVRSEEDVHPPQPGQIRAYFISTAQLEEGMFVRLHENLYLVKRVFIRIDEYVVKLKNVKTRVDFEATVKFSRANQEMWEPAEWWRRS